MIAYSTGVLIDYRHTIDGVQIREPQRRVWQNHQTNLDTACRLLNEGRYNILEFLTCVRLATPNFGTPRPQYFPAPQPLPAPWPLRVRQQINCKH